MATALASRGVFGEGANAAVEDGRGDNGLTDLIGEADGERGFHIARRLAGERALPVERGLVFLPQERLCHHVLVCGATGSGKTETLSSRLRVAKESDAPVFYLDGKGDRARPNASRADGRRGRQNACLPESVRSNGMEGEPHEITVG